MTTTKPRSRGILSRRNYAPRVIGNLLALLPLCIIFYLHRVGIFYWLYGLAVTLIWPHIAYSIGRNSLSNKTEYKILTFDSMLIGTYLPLVSFNLLPSVTAFIMHSQNTLGAGGLRLFLKGTVSFIFGALIFILIIGFDLKLVTNLWVMVSCIPALIVYPLTIGYTAYSSSKKLNQTRGKLKSQKEKLEDAYAEIEITLQETKRKEQEITNINQVVQTINSTLNLDAVLASVATALQQIFSFNQIAILVIDKEQKKLFFEKSYGEGFTSDQVEKCKKVKFPLRKDIAMCCYAALKNKSYYIPHITPEMVELFLPADKQVYEITRCKSYLFFPLEYQKKVIGVISIGDTRQSFKLTETDLDKIQRYVNQIASAINNAHLFEDSNSAKKIAEKRTAELKTEMKERQLAEEALRQSEEKYRSILDSMEDGYAEFDLAGNFVFFNKSHAAALEIDPDELMNQNFKEFMDEPTAKKMLNEFHELFLTGKPKLTEWEVITRKGRKFYAQGLVYLQKNSEGHPIGFRYLARDISIKRKAEVELKRAKDAAEIATKSKSDFLATMSHEIRTPMNAILGMSELLSEAPLPVEQKNLVKTISASGELLLSVINDILDFSKIESGQIELEKTVFDLNDLSDTSCKMLSVNAQEKGLDLNCRIAPDIKPFRIGDPTRLRQIIINLLSNAIKFTHQGEVVLEVVNSDDPKLLEFCVQDTGIGIPQDKQQSIFDSFTQADTSTTRKFGGTGLGLAICKRLVELMGGKIWAESEEGKGTRVCFTARFPETDQIPESSMASVKYSKLGLKPEEIILPPLRILLAEDVENNWKLIKLYLKDFPVSIDVAKNGAIAVEKYRKNLYDLVLMDSEMPEMDGLSATRAIRKWEKENNRRETPVVALTAHAFNEHKKKSMDAGCNGYLTKPIKKHVLIEKIFQFTGPESLINHHVEKTEHETTDKAEFSEDSCIVRIDAGIEELIPDFMSKTIEDLDVMLKALAELDSETLRRIGHSLKGSALMYEFNHLGNMGEVIEEAANIEDFKAIEDILEKLKQHLECIQIEYV